MYKGDLFMKKTIIWALLALASGAILGKVTFDRYENLEVQKTASIDDKVYMLRYGIYSSEDEMSSKLKKMDRYIYIEKDGKYKVYLGVTASSLNADKIVNLYILKGIKLKKEKVLINNEEFIQNLNQYEKLLDATNDEKSLIIIENQIMSCYEQTVVEDE